jgi:hypothetical protein
MNRTILSVLCCAALLCFTPGVKADDLAEHSSQHLTLHFAGPGARTLDVRAIEGNITVEASDGADVEMTIERSSTATNEEEMRAARRDVVLDTGDNAATIHAIVRYPNLQTCGGSNGYTSRPGYHVRYDFTIRVPRAVRLQLCTINNGTVLVSGTSGDFDISNVNGRIAIADATGSGEAVSVNGAVVASFNSAPQRASSFRTVNGDVTLTLPQLQSSDLHMKTLNGRVSNDFASAPNAPIAVVARGGAQLSLETLNGDVRVLRRSQ